MNIFRHIVEEEAIADFLTKRRVNYALLFQHQNRIYAYRFNRRASDEAAMMLAEYSTGYLVYVLNDDQFNSIKSIIKPINLKELEPVNEEIDVIQIPVTAFKK